MSEMQQLPLADNGVGSAPFEVGVGAPSDPAAKDWWDGAGAAALEEYTRVAEMRVQGMQVASQPVVLITQSPRSGGTLLARLFDGHPQLHAMPHEFSGRFSRVDRLLASPDAAWESLYDPYLPRHFRRGFLQSRRNLHEDNTAYPFVLPPLLQERMFRMLVGALEAPTERDVLDAYFSSYFNAWLDNQNLAGEKRWVTLFTPALLAGKQKLQRFDSLYPDGRVISVVREPKSWYASARRWAPDDFGDLEQAMATWTAHTARALKARALDRERVLIVPFEELVGRTERTMGVVCKWLGIDFLPSIVTPTFNSRPVKANSSFAVATSGVLDGPLARASSELSDDEREAVDAAADGRPPSLYGKARREWKTAWAEWK